MRIDPNAVAHWDVTRLVFEYNRLIAAIPKLEDDVRRESETERREYSHAQSETDREYIDARLKNARDAGLRVSSKLQEIREHQQALRIIEKELERR